MVENLTPSVVRAFLPQAHSFESRPLGNGLIHQTVLVTTGHGEFVFQRLNHNVFPDLSAVMRNIGQVTGFLRQNGIATLSFLTTTGGTYLFQDEDGYFWRCSENISDAATYDVPPTPAHLKNAAREFARFANSLSSAHGLKLHPTIPDFHHTPRRFEAMEKAWESAPRERQSVADFYALRLAAGGFDEWGLSGLLAPHVPQAVSHNDTKLNNCLFKGNSEEVICVIDLDTVMPGSWLCDFGDLCRTSICPLPEDTEELDKIDVDLDRFQALVEGYAETFGEEIRTEERERMVYSVFLLTYELALRFFTDHLQEDRYFGVKYPDHNLARTRAQLTLALKILDKRQEMERIVAAAFASATEGEEEQAQLSSP